MRKSVSVVTTRAVLLLVSLQQKHTTQLHCNDVEITHSHTQFWKLHPETSSVFFL